LVFEANADRGDQSGHRKSAGADLSRDQEIACEISKF
jgi:hypothetical protein